jgi:hypothetical protein
MEIYLEVKTQEEANKAEELGFNGVVSNGPTGKITFLRTEDLNSVGDCILLTENQELAKRARERKLRVAMMVSSVGKADADILVVPYGLLNPRSARLMGLRRVVAYGVNDPVVAKRLKEMGIKGVITSNPDLISEMEKLDRGTP